ncbi:hypothetical protein SAMN06296386_11068 [Lachnospiraceae bacterium]|nr:hypothetical protein SAMN06296386_11068 [Lachnospiraceae bacterium]
MNGINNIYGLYGQSGMMPEPWKKAESGKEKKTEKESKKFGTDAAAEYISSDRSGRAEKKKENLGIGESVQLSQAALDLLEELKKTYRNVDFFVGDYSNSYEAQKYLSQGTKEFSVLIEPELLEKMASDEATKQKYMGIIEDGTKKLAEMIDEFGDDGEDIKSIGFTVKEDGTLTYFAELRKLSDAQKARIEENREKKSEESKESEKNVDKDKKTYDLPKRTRVEADSVEGLFDAIRNIDWDKIEAPKKKHRAPLMDFSV